ncbi:D-2-hydroxyacid dehydrogenase [Facklamia miroungae]|uniref:D-lactate dehydrogenase n=1 Tax=Facklamia miroungae TaxID=120956 RepID=A0A1G7PBV7_9LACT|nr:D-2-hydroxyacid dehydrogenase [Facklamia miroungae]NKZ28656.1 D-2-hydroxyacid dehydrogenase [Facklamia miroungae]SDF83792.1 D-lactate dehydrogenase [Facklamia miroungae]
MYKIIMFNVRDEEEKIAKEWAIAHQIDLTIYHRSLEKEDLDTLKEYDGISLSQVAKVQPEFYHELAAMGYKQIAQRSAGFDMYDLDKATKEGIIISNVPIYSPESIAEWTVLMAGNLIRKYDSIQENVKNKNFAWDPQIRGRVIGDLNVAIIGTGNIGIATAKIFRGYGCQVVGYDLYPKEGLEDLLTYAETIDQAIEKADIISLHMPVTKETHHLFDYDRFKKIKKGAYLLNMARGAIINTSDLIKALDNDLLAGAALDTYENEMAYVGKNYKDATIEDEVFQQILNHPKIIYSPHIAFYTDQAVKNLVERGLNATLEVLETGTTQYRVN